VGETLRFKYRRQGTVEGSGQYPPKRVMIAIIYPKVTIRESSIFHSQKISGEWREIEFERTNSRVAEPFLRVPFHRIGDKSADKEVWTDTEVTESWELLQICGGEQGTIHVPTGVRHPGDGGQKSVSSRRGDASEDCEQSEG